MKASVNFYGMTPADLVLQAKIAGLEPDAVEILDRHYKQGYSDAEIASMRGQPRGTIASTRPLGNW